MSLNLSSDCGYHQHSVIYSVELNSIVGLGQPGVTFPIDLGNIACYHRTVVIASLVSPTSLIWTLLLANWAWRLKRGALTGGIQHMLSPTWCHPPHWPWTIYKCTNAIQLFSILLSLLATGQHAEMTNWWLLTAGSINYRLASINTMTALNPCKVLWEWFIHEDKCPVSICLCKQDTHRGNKLKHYSSAYS